MIETDIIIIGAGPVGLFTVFEAGLLKLRCHIIDVLPQAGGQLTEIYPKKPIYDIPGFPEVLAGDLIDNLMKQIEPFKPGFTLGEKAISIDAQEDGSFIVTTESGTQHKAPNIAIAGGLGVFEPRKPPVEHLDLFETKGIDYIIKEPKKYKDQRLVIAGGGDSALDWTIYLQELAKEITLVHRSGSFRGHPDSVQKVMDLNAQGKIKLKTYTEVKELRGNEHLTSVKTFNKKEEQDEWIETDYFLPLFGLSPKLGPIADWGIDMNNKKVSVDTEKFETSTKGLFAVGDINDYPGKLDLILCGFHETTLAVQEAYRRSYPGERVPFGYTTPNTKLQRKLGVSD